jgi:MFS family permease
MRPNRHEHPRLSRASIMYAVVALFLFFEMSVQVAPSVMAHQLIDTFQSSALSLGIMSGCYFYTYALMQIPSGMALDKFQPRWVITIAILICVMGNTLLGLAQDIYIASLARLLMGFGSAFAFVSVLVVTKDLFQPKHFAMITGITQALAALGAMAGQLPISILVGYVGWRNSLLLLSVIGLLIAILVFATIKYTRCFCEQIHWSCNAKKPSRYMVLLDSQTWWIALYAMLMWAPMSGFASLWGVPFLERVDGFSSSQAALVVSLMWLGLALFSPLLGHFSTRYNNRKYALVLSSLLGVASFLMVLSLHRHIMVVAIFVFLSGGACSGQALSFSVVKERSQRNVVAMAIALNNMAVVISGAIVQPLIGAALDHFAHLTSVPYEWALVPILCCYIIATGVAFVLIKPIMHSKEDPIFLHKSECS